MRSFKIDGVLFLSYGSQNSYYKKSFIKYDIQSLYIILGSPKEYTIFSVNYIAWSTENKLRFDCNKLGLDGRVSSGYHCYRNKILYYSSDLKLILKKFESLKLLS